MVAEMSSSELLHFALHCLEEELDDVLCKAASVWPHLADRLLTSVLIKRHRMQLHVAYKRLQSAGFEMNHRHLTAVSRSFMRLNRVPPDTWLQLPDFELLLSLWAPIDEAPVRQWWGLRFFCYWESLSQHDLTPEKLLHFRPLWENVSLTVGQKLSPDRVCSLNWPSKETYDLLHAYVDTNSDAINLTKELLQRGIITPALVNQHQGFIGALTQVDPQWLVEKVLSGEVALVKPRPSVALSLLRSLATVLSDPLWPELTKQNVRHLVKALEMLKHVEAASCMMSQGLESVMQLVAKLSTEDRAGVLKVVSGYYSDEGALRSRLAKVPNPQRGQAWYGDPTKTVRVYEAFIERAIDFITLDECTSHVRPCKECPMSDAVCSKFYRWALAQPDEQQESGQVLRLLQHWVVKTCSPQQVLAIWLKMVEAMNSWSFLINSWAALPSRDAARGEEELLIAQSVYSRVAQQLALEPRASSERRRRVMLQLSKHWPERFVEQFGIRTWLELSKVDVSNVKLVPRKSRRLSEGSEQINDALLPEQEFQAVLREHPTIEKTKKNDDWHNLVLDWIRGLDVRLFCDAAIAERMSQIMCAVWPDKAALCAACGDFCSRLLQGIAVTKDCTALVKFIRKCPNLGNKKCFLLQQFQAHAAGPDRAELGDLHPLLASQVTKVEDLVDFIHALRYGNISGDTESMFYKLMKNETPYEQVQILKRCEFSCSSRCSPLDECVEAEHQFWLELEDQETEECQVDKQNQDIVPEPDWHELPKQVEGQPVRTEPACTLYKKFGVHGESIFSEFLASAEPAQLCELFSGSDAFRNLCHVSMRSWHLSHCPEGQGDALVRIITEWFPELYERFAPKVWEASEDESSEARIKRLLVGRVPDLDALPRSWWRCVDFSKVKEEDLGRLVEAGVVVHPRNVAFKALMCATQQSILESHCNDVEVLAEFAPQVTARIPQHVERFFELLSRSEELLVKIGDGLDRPEQLASGQNKMVHRLLTAIRDRIKSGNFLHSCEQLVLFGKCAGHMDNTNSSLLADLMESKYVDPMHIASIVDFVLCTSGFNHQVRDSALRAIMRLEQNDRDNLHKRLLHTNPKLPLQVLFSLSVTVLHEQVIPLVLKQLEALSPLEWDELLGLIRDANPLRGKLHTFPRSLRAQFSERFLACYLSDKQRDVRLLNLFAACADSALLPQLLADVLARQLHTLDDRLFDLLSFPLTTPQFEDILEYIQPRDWASRMHWVLTQVHQSSEPYAMLLLVVGLLANKSFAAVSTGLFQQVIQWAHEGEEGVLLKDVRLRELLLGALPNHRALRVTFFRVSWLVGMPGAPEARAAEMTQALDLEKLPLSRSEVELLGVDLPSRKLLVRLAGALAVPLHGLAILKQEPGFSKTLTDEQFAQIIQLDASDDAQWPLFRRLIAESQADRALQLSIILLRHSQEDLDIELVKFAYHSVGRFVRKQTCLRTELASVWKKFGAKIQRDVIDAVSCSHTMAAVVADFKPIDVTYEQGA